MVECGETIRSFPVLRSWDSSTCEQMSGSGDLLKGRFRANFDDGGVSMYNKGNVFEFDSLLSIFIFSDIFYLIKFEL